MRPANVLINQLEEIFQLYFAEILFQIDSGQRLPDSGSVILFSGQCLFDFTHIFRTEEITENFAVLNDSFFSLQDADQSIRPDNVSNAEG